MFELLKPELLWLRGYPHAGGKIGYCFTSATMPALSRAVIDYLDLGQ